MDLWAVARYDLGLDWDEFADLTPSMFNALCKRRNIRLKHERFANALTAATVWNSRGGLGGEPVSPYDYVREGKAAEEREQVNTLKRQIKKAVTDMPQNTPREKFMRLRKNILAEIVKLGRTDGAELWAECWPSLTPKERE